MRILQKIAVCACVLISIAVFATPKVAFAQTDEIQVYDASIAEKGKFNLTLHSNFTPSGQKTPAFPGAIVADKSFNGVPEWAYGATEWFEVGLYMPLYSISKDRGGSLNGFKGRLLFVRPHADDHTFIYGMNFEFSYNARYWDPKRATAEIRPIIGWHLHPVESQKLKSSASVDSNGTLPYLVLIEYSRTDRFSRESIVGSTV